MPNLDPIMPLRDWRSSLYRGGAAVVEEFLNAIDNGLPSGWRRDAEYERTRERPERVRCYLFDKSGDAAVRVWLQRVTPTRLRGGPVQVIRHPPAGDSARIGELTSELTNACVLPAAATVSIRETRPSFGLRSQVTPAVDMVFTRLADTADGKWPLIGAEQVLWNELVATCLGESAAIDRAELEQWLVDSGWEQEIVSSIADRFFADSEWFAERLAVTAL